MLHYSCGRINVFARAVHQNTRQALNQSAHMHEKLQKCMANGYMHATPKDMILEPFWSEKAGKRF